MGFSVSLSALEETGVGSCVLPSFLSCLVPGEGRDNGRGKAVGGLQGEGTAFLVFHPT